MIDLGQWAVSKVADALLFVKFACIRRSFQHLGKPRMWIQSFLPDFVRRYLFCLISKTS